MTGTLQKALALAGVAGTAFTPSSSPLAWHHVGGLVDPTGSARVPNATIHISARNGTGCSRRKDEADRHAISSKVMPFEDGRKVARVHRGRDDRSHAGSQRRHSSNNDIFLPWRSRHSYVHLVKKRRGHPVDGDHAAGGCDAVQSGPASHRQDAVYAATYHSRASGEIVGQVKT